MWSRLGRAAVTSKAGLKVAGKAVAVASASAVAFGAKVALCEEAPKPAVCPVNHQAKAAPAEVTEKKAVCPVRHDQQQPVEEKKAVCPVRHGQAPSAPPPALAAGGNDGSHRGMGNDDGKDRYVHPFERSATKLRTSKEEFPNIDNPDEVPGGRIPSTGRGNSEDGSEWLNPTPAELFRALRRKDKHIEEDEAWSVAFVHSAVVDQTWALILEYEDLHRRQCLDPTLIRFEGKYGDHTIKTKLTTSLISPNLIPFDRHDWYVNRCGKEVRYIIDYYSPESKDGVEEYFVDCRPAPTPGGLIDRARMAWKRWRKGEAVW